MKIIAFYSIYRDSKFNGLVGEDEVFSFDLSKKGLKFPLPVGSSIDFSTKKYEGALIAFNVSSIEYYINRPDSIFLHLELPYVDFCDIEELVDILRTTWEGEVR